MKLFLTSILLLSVLCAPAFAQENILNSASDSNEPIEITAQQSLEWHRDDLKFIARGQAMAKQGMTSVSGSTLTADYISSDESNIDIQRLTADGNVTIRNTDNTGYGDKAVYDVKTQTATLTGSDLKLVSPDQTITASEKFVYEMTARKAKAIGDATVIRGTDKLKANTIEAIFKEQGGSGQDAIDRLEANGNVVITTAEEVLTGNKAIYRADTNTAEIMGNVKIKRGPNILEGGRAEVNLTTNVSKMFGADSTGERVRGIFYPGSEPKPDNSN